MNRFLKGSFLIDQNPDCTYCRLFQRRNASMEGSKSLSLLSYQRMNKIIIPSRNYADFKLGKTVVFTKFLIRFAGILIAFKLRKESMIKQPVFTLVLCTLLFSLACNKKTDEPAYYVRFTMNGHQMSFPNAVGDMITDPVFPDKTIIQVTGVSSNQQESFGFIIRGDHADMNQTTYTSNSPDVEFYALYSVQYNATGDSYAYDISDASGREPAVYSVTFTSITDTEIRGNFTGNYLHNDLLTGSGVDDVIEITSGEFKIKRN